MVRISSSHQSARFRSFDPLIHSPPPFIETGISIKNPGGGLMSQDMGRTVFGCLDSIPASPQPYNAADGDPTSIASREK